MSDDECPECGLPIATDDQGYVFKEDNELCIRSGQECEKPDGERMDWRASYKHVREVADQLRAQLATVTAERDKFRDDGRSLVALFEGITRTLNEIGWPSDPGGVYARATGAIRQLGATRDAIAAVRQEAHDQRDQLEAERDQARMEAHRLSTVNRAVDVHHIRLRDGLRRALDTWSAHLTGLEKRLVGGPDGGTRAERAEIAKLRRLVQP